MTVALGMRCLAKGMKSDTGDICKKVIAKSCKMLQNVAAIDFMIFGGLL